MTIDANLAVALAAFFAAVAVVAGSLTFFALERASISPIRRRLQATIRARVRVSEASTLLPTDPALIQFLKRASRAIGGSPKHMSKLQRRLAFAGYEQPWHVLAYSVAEPVCAILGFVVTLWIAGFPGGLLYAVMAAVGAYLLPGVLLERAIRARRRSLENGLPDALDLLIVCLEAGLGLDQAILKCAEELEVSHPALADELRLINIETRAGVARIDAFKNFASRTGAEDVRSLVAMLVQTDRFGTSIAQALRTHADVSRTKRRQRAEEAAAKMGVKLVFPLVFCLFPAFYVVTLGPAIIKFVHAFDGASIMSIPGGLPR